MIYNGDRAGQCRRRKWTPEENVEQTQLDGRHGQSWRLSPSASQWVKESMALRSVTPQLLLYRRLRTHYFTTNPCRARNDLKGHLIWFRNFFFKMRKSRFWKFETRQNLKTNERTGSRGWFSGSAQLSALCHLDLSLHGGQSPHDHTCPMSERNTDVSLDEPCGDSVDDDTGRQRRKAAWIHSRSPLQEPQRCRGIQGNGGACPWLNESRQSGAW